jgi:hypothetical protein
MLFVLAGIPLIAYLWETANRVFAGRIELVRLLIAAAAVIALLLVLKILARVIEQWERTRFD